MKVSSNHKTLLYLTLTTLIVLFSIAKLIHLTADFPHGITWSGVLYYDEGWYTNAATNAFMLDKAHKEKDFNPAANIPLPYVLQYVNFKLFGKSLWNARSISVLFTFLTTFIIYRLVATHSDTKYGLLAALLHSSHFFVFSFSRLAILEPIYLFFSLSSLLFALYARKQSANTPLIISACLVSIGILTKPTALFVIPAIIFLLATEKSTVRYRAMRITLFIAVSSIIWSAWYIYSFIVFHDDFLFFNSLNISTRSSLIVGDIFRRLVLTFDLLTKTEPYLFLLLLPLFGVLVFRSSSFRNNLLIQASIISFIFYFFMLSMVHYHPPRYLLPLTQILIILVPLCVFYYKTTISIGTPALLLLIFLFIGLNGYHIVSYISHPKYSFITMMKEVGAIVSKAEHYEDRRIIGRMTDSIALEENIYPLNSGLSPYPLDERLSLYWPEYYIGFRKEAFELFMEASTLISNLELIQEWAVFDDYYDWGPVQLYRIHYGDR